MYEKGYADFWDYWSAVVESSSIVNAFNEIKKSELSTDEDVDVAENLIAAYLYEESDKNIRKIDMRPVRLLISSVGANKFGDKHSWDRIVSRQCLNTLKQIIFKKQPKIYQKCADLVKESL